VMGEMVVMEVPPVPGRGRAVGVEGIEAVQAGDERRVVDRDMEAGCTPRLLPNFYIP